MHRTKKKYREIIKITLVILLIVAVFACLIGYCVKENKKVETSREIINVQYIPQSADVETEYRYKFDFVKGNFTLVPEVKTVHKPERYQIQYRVAYDRGKPVDEWETVTKAEYEKAKEELGG